VLESKRNKGALNKGVLGHVGLKTLTNSSAPFKDDA